MEEIQKPKNCCSLHPRTTIRLIETTIAFLCVAIYASGLIVAGIKLAEYSEILKYENCTKREFREEELGLAFHNCDNRNLPDEEVKYYKSASWALVILIFCGSIGFIGLLIFELIHLSIVYLVTYNIKELEDYYKKSIFYPKYNLSGIIAGLICTLLFIGIGTIFYYFGAQFTIHKFDQPDDGTILNNAGRATLLIVFGTPFVLIGICCCALSCCSMWVSREEYEKEMKKKRIEMEKKRIEKKIIESL